MLLIFCLKRWKRGTSSGDHATREQSSIGSPKVWEESFRDNGTDVVMPIAGGALGDRGDSIGQIGGRLRYPDEGARLREDGFEQTGGRLHLTDDWTQLRESVHSQ